MASKTDLSPLVTSAAGVASDLGALFASQWYLGAPGTNGVPGAWAVDLEPVWAEYRGRGIKVGIIDEGFDLDHPDLAGRFDLSLSYDPRDAGTAQSLLPDSTGSRHGTWVSGVLGALRADGTGMVGVASGATLAGLYMRFGSSGSSLSEVVDLFNRAKAMDVVNLSWVFTASFSDNFRNPALSGLAGSIADALATGRDGLGTIFVAAAGNDRKYVAGDPSLDGGNTNAHNLENHRGIITVAASDQNGAVASFSTPGASVFVTAPGTQIFTTSVGTLDGITLADDYTSAAGTSFATPIVSGVVALMLEAEPLLTYRDVQHILASSARVLADPVTGWDQNGATTLNGGGYHVSHDFGFGLVDARAAVRLAESWRQFGPTGDAILIDTSPTALPGAIPDLGAASRTVTVAAAGVAVEWAEVDVDIKHAHLGDLRVTLTSPDGTTSILMDRPGAGTLATDDLSFTLTTNHAWGEDPAGVWTLTVEDLGSGGTGSLAGWDLRLYGRDTTAGNVFIFNEEYAALDRGDGAIAGGAARDVVNAAAVTGVVAVDLGTARATLGGRALSMVDAGLIDDVAGGDSNDVITGNGLANLLDGGRGGDLLRGGAGNDTLDGGAGADQMWGGPGDDSFVIDTLSDFVSEAAGEGNDTIRTGLSLSIASNPYIENLVGLGSAALRLAGNAAANRVNGGAGDDTLWGLDGTDILTGAAGRDRLDGGTGADTMAGGTDADTYFVDGAGDRVLENAGEGRDIVYATADWTMTAGQEIEFAVANGAAAISLTGNELGGQLQGNAAANRPDGGAGDDVLYGLGGNDTLLGGEGRDRLDGGIGADAMAGGGGNDVFYVDNAVDTVAEAAGGGTDVIYAAVSWQVTAGAEIEVVQATGTTAIDLLGNELTDRLRGNEAANRLDGGSGSDVLTGNGGDDRLIGGDGRDILNGGAGTDHLWGGTGGDVFTFAAGSGIDFVGDFTRKEADRLSFSGFAAGTDPAKIGFAAADGFHLDFGNGDVLILAGITSLLSTDWVFA